MSELARFGAWFRRSDPNVMRLQAALFDAHRRLAHLQATRGEADPVVQACAAALQNAVKQADANATFIAWDCLHQFNDELLRALDPAELSVLWASLCAEADQKLTDWRAKAAEALKKKVPANAPVPLEVVRELQAHLAAAAQNQQHKIDVYAKKTIPTLIFFLTLVIAGTLWFCVSVLTIPGASADLVRWADSILLGIVAGALGGILSMTFTLGQVDLSRKIPDMRLSAKVTLMRPLLGAAVAIPVVVLVEAKYVQIEGFDKPLSTMAFAFIAGFSERWFLGVVEKLSKK